MITGTMLRDLVVCPRRVHHDTHSPSDRRDPVGAFVELLWAGGRAHEEDIVSRLDGGIADLRGVDRPHRALATLDALRGGHDHILGALLEHDDLLGMPDIISRTQEGWSAVDVKSGDPFEADGRRPRKEYAVQVAHYATLLSYAMGSAAAAGVAYVIGKDGKRRRYDLDARWDRSGGTLTQITNDLTQTARSILTRSFEVKGAASSICKLCHWHTVCERELVEADDPTLVAGIGRSVRDAIAAFAPTIDALARIDPATVTCKGVGSDRLYRFRDRAVLLTTPGAYAYALRDLELPAGRRELHLDIEADPSRDSFVYLFGFLVREAGSAVAEGRYVPFFANDQDEEAGAFAAAVEFMRSDPDAIVYCYSKYERTAFRALQKRHPAVCSPSDIEELFDSRRNVDLLYDVITPATEWPTRNLSIKTLARHLGFDWRDVDASGASSIAWFDEYARTGSAAVRRRILDYNEDDVRASAVVLDGLRALPVHKSNPHLSGKRR